MTDFLNEGSPLGRDVRYGLSKVYDYLNDPRYGEAARKNQAQIDETQRLLKLANSARPQSEAEYNANSRAYADYRASIGRRRPTDKPADIGPAIIGPQTANGLLMRDQYEPEYGGFFGNTGTPDPSDGPPVDPIRKAVLENNVPPEVLQEVEPQPVTEIQQETVSPVNNSLSNEGLGRLNGANLEGLGQDIERAAPPEPQSKGMLDGLRNVFQNPDFNDKLVQHLQGMSVNPNEAVIKRAGDNILLRKGKAELNRTADYVENTLGNKGYADAIREGFMTPADALASLTGTGTQTDAFKTLHQKAIASGLTAGTEEYQKYMGSNGSYDAEKQKLTNEGTLISAKNVLESIGDIKGFVLGADGPLGNNVTGLQGKIAAKIAGTDAYNVSKISNTIKANIGFDRLTAMREASPTGGALGQVSNIEIELLQSTIKSLDQFVSRDVYLKNLESIETQYKEILRKAAGYDPEVLKAAGVDQLLLNSNMYGKNSTGKIIKFNMQGERI